MHNNSIPMYNKEFWSFSRRARILTAGILEVFRGLKFEHNTEKGQNTKLYNGIIEASAPCRLDLGGTLDIKPFHLLLKDKRVSTFNIALDLRTTVTIRPHHQDKIKVTSKGFRPIEFFYDKVRYDTPLGLIFRVASHFRCKGIHIKIKSESPPKSGLGGSSAAIIALIYGLSKLTRTTDENHDRSLYNTLLTAHKIEEKTLGILCGMQDYLAACYGGANLWQWPLNEKDPLFIRKKITDKKKRLQDHIIVAYSGSEHNSKDINPKWIKDFLEKKNIDTRRNIAELTSEFAEAVSKSNMKKAADIMNLETRLRKSITTGLFNKTGEKLTAAAENCGCGARFTGAGGGGCIWAIGESENISILRKDWENILATIDNGYILNNRIANTGVQAKFIKNE